MPAVMRGCLLCVLLLADNTWCVAQEAKTTPDDAATINRILVDWKTRWERVDTVAYRLEGTREYKAGAMTGAPGAPRGPVPEKNIRSRVERRIEIDFRNGRARHESDLDLFGPNGHPMRSYSINLFDGEHRVRYAPRDRQPPIPRSHIGTETHYDYSEVVEFFTSVEPLLFAHGIVRFSPAVKDFSKPRDDADSFRILRRETLKDRPCVILSDSTAPERFPAELWVDLERASAIVQVKRPLDGRLRRTHQIDYGETEQGWMPQSWTCMEWTLTEPLRPFQIEKLWVEGVTENPELPLQRFRVKPEVGMVYRRTGHDDGWVYQGEGVPAIEAADYWIMKGWAKKRSPRQGPPSEPPPVDPY